MPPIDGGYRLAKTYNFILTTIAELRNHEMNQKISSKDRLSAPAIARFESMSRLLQNEEIDITKAAVIEFGTGSARLSRVLKRQATLYLGVEPDEESRALSNSWLKSQCVFESPDELLRKLRSIPNLPDFAIIVCCEVIEHLANEDEVLDPISQVVSQFPASAIVITTPKSRKDGSLSLWDENVGHLRRYDSARLRLLLQNKFSAEIRVESYGFVVIALSEFVLNIRLKARKRFVSRDQASNPVSGTFSSGRQFQPKALGAFLRWAMVQPLLFFQRTNSTSGRGLIAVVRFTQ